MAVVSGGDKLERALAEIAKRLGNKPTSVSVGFLEGATYPEGQSVAMVAALNNFGTGRAPPRPFFSNMVAEKSPTWAAGLAQALIATNNDAAKALEIVGEGIEGQLKQSIIDYDAGPPLAASTVRRKGFDKQLVDKGIMLAGTGHQVKS